MKNERQFITIKSWFYDKTEDISSSYKCYINRYEKEKETGEAVKVLVEQVLAESEKAVQVVLATGDADGSVKGWKTWVPKSAIIA